MDKLRKQQPGLPYNPGLRELIDGKRRGTQPLQIQQEKQGFRGWHERGYLPHRDEPGMTQFVTFRLADSFPESRRSEWEHLWKIESDQQRRIKLEAYLDRGRGECHLRDPAVADLVVKGLLFFQARKYNLLSWCIMPNHVHALFKVTDVPMSEIMASWKKHTAQKANRILNRRGKFWEEDYWDTYMRDAEQERKSVRYIENNPTKAKLVRAPEDWRWSSARYRDKFGKLQI